MDEIYQKYARFVYRYLLSLGAGEEVAEEVMQETFFQAVRSIHTYKGESKLSTWLCAIARNQYAKYRKKNPGHISFDETFMAYAINDPPAQVEVFKSMQILPGNTREIMYLRIYGNLSFRQIGEVLGISENTARVTYYRAREKLRKEMEENGRE